MDNKCNGTVEVELKGGLGNRLFQYFTARIYAEINKLNLLTNLNIDDLNIKPNKTK